MFKNRSIYILVGLLIVLNLTLLTVLWFSAKGKKHHHRPMPERYNVSERLREDLDLTDDQYELVYESREKFQDDLFEIRKDAKETRRALFDALVNIDPDTINARKLAVEFGTQRENEEVLLIEHYLDLWQICDEEQKAALVPIFRRILKTEERGGPKGHGPKRHGHKGHGPPKRPH